MGNSSTHNSHDMAVERINEENCFEVVYVDGKINTTSNNQKLIRKLRLR